MQEAAKLGLVVGGSAAVGSGIWWFFFRKAPVALPPPASSAPPPVIDPKKQKFVLTPGEVAPTSSKPSTFTLLDENKNPWVISLWKEGNVYKWFGMFAGNAAFGIYRKTPLLKGENPRIEMIPSTSLSTIDKWVTAAEAAEAEAEQQATIAKMKSEYGA